MPARGFCIYESTVLKKATDWDRYYASVPVTATFTRKYTARAIVAAMKRYAPTRPWVLEFGGANSCFADAVLEAMKPVRYDTIDTNEYGLSLLRKRMSSAPVRTFKQDILNLSYEHKVDLVFSVGLIEHFNIQETRSAILAHFDVLRKEGIAIITFPTPTRLYRVTRKSIELLGMWKFPDERPLRRGEVRAAIGECGDILFEKTLWPLMLTQHLIVARKR